MSYIWSRLKAFFKTDNNPCKADFNFLFRDWKLRCYFYMEVHTASKGWLLEFNSCVSMCKAQDLFATLCCSRILELGIQQNPILLNLNKSLLISLSEIFELNITSSPPNSTGG